MLFEVLRGKTPLASTTFPSCLYDWRTVQCMQRAGLSFRVNGKPWKPTRAGLEELRREENE